MTKMIIIGDEATVTGLKLAGLKNAVVADEESVSGVLRGLPEEIDIIVISRHLREAAKHELFKMKEKMVIDLPDSAEEEGEDIVSKMIREVIGFDTAK